MENGNSFKDVDRIFQDVTTSASEKYAWFLKQDPEKVAYLNILCKKIKDWDRFKEIIHKYIKTC